MRLIRPLFWIAAVLFAGQAGGADFSPVPGIARMTEATPAAVPFDLATLKRNWKQRIGE